MKKGLIQILIANSINLLLSIVSGFILPKYLSIPEYGVVKTFHLYITYVGFLHLGYIDGVYLLYGGKKYDSLNKEDYLSRLNAFKIFQLAVTFVAIIISIICKDFVLLCFSISIYPYNLAMYYKLVFQAVGRFKDYSRLINISTVLSVFGLIVLMLFRIKDGRPFVVAYVLSYIVIAVIVDIVESRKLKTPNKHLGSFKESVKLIKSGFLLMLGNFTALLLTGMDRWCIKFFMPDTGAFSYYSFAVSLQAMLEAVVSPITIVFYNVLCNEKDSKKINEIRKYCIILGIYLMILAHFCKIIINVFIQQYIPSLTVIFVLFAAESLYVLIKGIFINLYKARKQQNKYFIKLTFIIILALVLNISFYLLLHTMEAFAYATYLSTFIWLILCCFDFKECSLNKIEWIILITSSIVLFASNMSDMFGIFVYIAYVALISLIFYRTEIKYLIGLLFAKINKILGRI